MRNSVQADVVAAVSQDFILLTGVPSVADHFALGKEKRRWKAFRSRGCSFDLKSASLIRWDAFAKPKRCGSWDVALPGVSLDQLRTFLREEDALSESHAHPSETPKGRGDAQLWARACEQEGSRQQQGSLQHAAARAFEMFRKTKIESKRIY